jgi:hypothetical protein
MRFAGEEHDEQCRPRSIDTRRIEASVAANINHQQAGESASMDQFIRIIFRSVGGSVQAWWAAACDGRDRGGG